MSINQLESHGLASYFVIGVRALRPCVCKLFRRLYGQQVAVKCVDACNSAQLVMLLQHEAMVLSGTSLANLLLSATFF